MIACRMRSVGRMAVLPCTAASRARHANRRSGLECMKSVRADIATPQHRQHHRDSADQITSATACSARTITTASIDRPRL